MVLPAFRYHPDPVASGSVTASSDVCACCEKARGFIYTTPIYAEREVAGVCPWCIKDGWAHQKFSATFVDEEAFAIGIPDKVIEEIAWRTPGYSAWQGEEWPSCCDDATAFIAPVGIKEIRAQYRELEGLAMAHIVHAMDTSGGAATRMLESLNREKGPTAYLFRCLHCEQMHMHIDRT